MTESTQAPRRAWDSRGKQCWYWFLLVCSIANVVFVAIDLAGGYTGRALLNGVAAASSIWMALLWRGEFSAAVSQ